MIKEFTEEERKELESIQVLLDSNDRESKRLGENMLTTCSFLQEEVFKHVILIVSENYTIHKKFTKRWDGWEELGGVSKTLAQRIKFPSIQKPYGLTKNASSILVSLLLDEDNHYVCESTDGYFYSIKFAPNFYIDENAIINKNLSIRSYNQYINACKVKIEEYQDSISAYQRSISNLKNDISELKEKNSKIKTQFPELKKLK